MKTITANCPTCNAHVYFGMSHCPYCGAAILFEEKMGKFVVREAKLGKKKRVPNTIAVQNVTKHMSRGVLVTEAKCVEFMPVPGAPHITQAKNVEYVTFDWGKDIFASKPTPQPTKEDRDECIVMCVGILITGAILYILSLLAGTL